MYKIILQLLVIASAIGCKPNNSNTNGSTVSYANGCCCNTIFTTGIGKIFIPSVFTPNLDGVNDVLTIYGDTNIKYITNCVIKDSLGAVITTIDTAKEGKFWDGFYNNGNFYRGICNVTCSVTDKTNTVSTIAATTSVFTCDSNINLIHNNANCILPDQYNPINGGINSATSEPCF